MSFGYRINHSPQGCRFEVTTTDSIGAPLQAVGMTGDGCELGMAARGLGFPPNESGNASEARAIANSNFFWNRHLTTEIVVNPRSAHYAPMVGAFALELAAREAVMDPALAAEAGLFEAAPAADISAPQS